MKKHLQRFIDELLSIIYELFSTNLSFHYLEGGSVEYIESKHPSEDMSLKVYIKKIQLKYHQVFTAMY